MSTISRPLFPPVVSLTSAGAAVNTTKAPDTTIVMAGDSLLPQRSRHCSPRLRLRSRAGRARLRRRRAPGGTKGPVTLASCAAGRCLPGALSSPGTAAMPPARLPVSYRSHRQLAGPTAVAPSSVRRSAIVSGAHFFSLDKQSLQEST